MAMLNNQRVDQIPGKFPEGHPSMVTLARRWTHGNYRFAGLHQCAWAIHGEISIAMWLISGLHIDL